MSLRQPVTNSSSVTVRGSEQDPGEDATHRGRAGSECRRATRERPLPEDRKGGPEPHDLRGTPRPALRHSRASGFAVETPATTHAQFSSPRGTCGPSGPRCPCSAPAPISRALVQSRRVFPVKHVPSKESQLTVWVTREQREAWVWQRGGRVLKASTAEPSWEQGAPQRAGLTGGEGVEARACPEAVLRPPA